MQGERRRGFPIEPLEKRDELLRAVPRMTLANHHAIEQAQRRKQRRRAVPNVIVRLPLGEVRLQRQDRPRAVQRLDIAFLVHGEHDGGCR